MICEVIMLLLEILTKNVFYARKVMSFCQQSEEVNFLVNILLLVPRYSIFTILCELPKEQTLLYLGYFVSYLQL